MPDPTDFDDAPRTVLDGTPLEPEDLTDEVEVADETAEALAVDGPPDDDAEITPNVSVEDACGHCRLVKVQRVADFVPPPQSCSEAWHLRTCCATRRGYWSWCQIRGLLSVDGVVTDCNRRKSAWTPPEGTPERRRAR